MEQAGRRRVYLDFPGVSPQVAAVTNIGTDPIDKVRVALNSREPIVTRVVIDLARDAQYHVESAGADGRDLRIGFTTGGQAGQACDGRVEHATVSRPRRRTLRRPRAVAPHRRDLAHLSHRLLRTVHPPRLPRHLRLSHLPHLALRHLSHLRPAPHRPPRPSGKQYSGHPVSLDFQGADLRAVLRTFAEISGLNIVIDPAVQGSVDVSLRDVPWDQALDIILRANKLGYSVDGTIVRVAPLNVLADEEKQRRQLAEQQALAGELQVADRSRSATRRPTR